MEQARGKGFLKVTGILMIIGGAIGIIMAIVAMVGAGATASLFYDTTGVELAVGLLILAGVVSLIGGALELVTGILGVKNCGDPSKATICIVFGIIVAALCIISNIIYFSGVFSLLLGLVLPVLYLIGAFLNKNSVSQEA